MLVTFKCEVYADTTYFGDVAKTLLKMLGHSGTVPGAILADDVPQALERLQSAIAAIKAANEKPAAATDDDNAWKEAPVTLAQRALPLLELLSAAAKKPCNVMWDKY